LRNRADFPRRPPPTTEAIARSGAGGRGGPKGNNGYGNGGGDRSPNGKEDKYR
jgi:hypothetical protein